MEKSADALRTISEVATELDVPKHVLRFWESKFTQINPMKRGGGRRYYRPADIELLRGIQRLLYGEGYTIRGVQQILKREGVDYVKNLKPALLSSKKPAEKSKRTALDIKPKKAAKASSIPQSDEALLNSLLSEIESCRRLLQQD